MRFIGHTMGTPDLAPTESATLFARLGFDGMELICRQGTGFAPEVTEAEAGALAANARRLGAPVLTLTPYAWDFNSADAVKAAADAALLCRSVDLAALMGARYVRAYGGRPGPEGEPATAAFERAVQGLATHGRYAAQRQVTLLVENHPGTLTRTGRATRDLVERVGLASVRALYDPANVLHDTDEPWEETLALQTGLIEYVHVKDYFMDGKTRRACCVGDGLVPWQAILERLVAAGYDGPLSFEYEKKWYPADLPDAADGMKRSLEHVKRVPGT